MQTNFESRKKYYINEQNCQVWVIENYITKEEEKKLFDELKSLPLIQFSLGQKFGKEWKQNRLSMALNKSYKYSGKEHPSVPWSSFAKELNDRLNTDFKRSFNGALVNDYVDGKHFISDHNDNEDTLAENGSVYGISVGAERDMVMKWKDGDGKITFSLPSGSLFAMEGDTQKHLTHGMPKRLKVKDERISITFRQFK